MAHFAFRGALKGHNGWVTSIVTTPEAPDMVVSGSRDKSIIVWHLSRDEIDYGVPRKSLLGHNHFVQDLAISSDGQYVLSASWDQSLRLWDISTGETTRRFIGHASDVLSVSFSPDNRQIVSGSRDKTIKLWNTLGECKFSITDKGHQDWVSCVRFSPNPAMPAIVSAGWDKVVKVWDLTKLQLRNNFLGHNGYINTIAISPDGSLCASAGKDGIVQLWDLKEGKPLYSLDAGEEVHTFAFSPSRYWLCAGTKSGIKVWDLEKQELLDDLRPTADAGAQVSTPCLSLAFSSDGTTLFSGHTDNLIRVWTVISTL